ncbi:MAG: ABC transporter substrate-binding protein [Nitrospirota bacterium]
MSCAALGIVFFVVSCSGRENSVPLLSDKDRPFVVALDSAPTQLDPRLSTDAYSERIGHLLFNSLIRTSANGEIVPDLASRWEIQDDTIYTFYLKDAVKFHDGKPLTSEDVRYTYLSMQEESLASPRAKTYEIVKAIETPNLTTVRFILEKPNAPFLSQMTTGIVPKHLAEGNPEGFAKSLIGSGPFSFVQYQPDHFLELRAFPGYTISPPPLLSSILFRIIPDESTRLLELAKGNIDLLQNVFPPDMLVRLQKNPALKIERAESTTYSYLGFNLTDPILGKVAVREAIAHAIDKEKITKYIFQGLAHPANSLLTERHWAYAPTPTRSYDLKRAAALLDEAGYTKDRLGIRFRLIYKTSQNELGRRVAEVIQEELSQTGIAVTIRSYEWGTFFSDVKSGNFQLFSLQWVGVNDPDIFYELFHSQSVPPNGSNRVRYQNEKMDKLVEEGRVLVDPDQRKPVYKAVQEILAKDVPYVSLWHTKNVAVMKKEVIGYTLYANGDFYALSHTARSQ